MSSFLGLSLYELQSVFQTGLILAVMAIGIFISFRILDIPDLSVDGTFTLGVVVSGAFTLNGYPVLGMVCAFISGFIAGGVTGFLITKMNIQPILAGILTMTGLYSINLRILGIGVKASSGVSPNASLRDKQTAFDGFKALFPESMADYTNLILQLLIVVGIAVLLHLFLKTQIGLSLRATGDNEFMVRATSISSNKMKMLGLALANALVSLSGGIWAQSQKLADTNSGIGMLVTGLASIILGEVFFRKRTVIFGICAAIVGAIIYRFIYAEAMNLGLQATDLKLLTALIVIVVIYLSRIKIIKAIKEKRRNHASNQ